MLLSQLLDDADAAAIVTATRGDLDVEVTSITHDSRVVVAGALYVCLPGRRVDGHDFAPDAVAQGAVALLCERTLEVEAPQVVVDDARGCMPHLAAALHGQPSRHMTVVGVTGTDGKSTTTLLLRSIFEANGWSSEIIGGNLVSADARPDGSRPSNTPEAPELQAALAVARAAGRDAVVMEVSSPALAERRVDATWFSAAVFTNLSQDHLDYHGDMESYFAAKARLFEPERAALAVVNADDAYGRRLLDQLEVPTHTFSLGDADELELRPAGSRFRWRGQEVAVALPGRYNVSNALAAAETARALGVDSAVVATGLAAVRGAPGRFERVDEGQGFEVVVDYAHTPGGLHEVLTAAAELSGRKPVVVFGCGGDKDREKRPLMGAAASEVARLVVLTSDNPRSEDPRAIIDDIRAGIPQSTHVVVEPDRSIAIAIALAAAEPGDVVVIAGKGHEVGQTLGGYTTPFDDRVVARDHLRELIAR